jgi:aspartyl-tRNA(Asn)/glutamyl-tRNA(Gln) amidotransferase subunit A
MDQPWRDDACSLVDAFRAGERSPKEELEASLAAIERSDLNCFSFLDPERALKAAKSADVSLPFGGVPTGIKELESLEGWPATEASLVFRDRRATYTTTVLERLIGGGGVVPVGLTTASEFGGLNVSITKQNGVTHNPWRYGRTVGGSSGGSAAAVSGGLVSLATGGDGGGSLRIPAGYTGLVGFKGTYGRIPRGPKTFFRPGTVVLGCLARSVRDVARHYDVCAGEDVRDPWSLPSAGGWEQGLGTSDLAGKTLAVVPSLGGVDLEPGVEARIRAGAEALAASTGMRLIEIELDLPNLAAQWMMGNLATLLAELGDLWPGCADELTDEVAMGLRMSQSLYNLNTAAVAESQRIEANEVMARAFEAADFIVAATNPGPAFSAEASMSSPTASFLDWAKTNDSAKVAFRAAMAAVRVASGVAPKLPNLLLDQASRLFPDLVNMGGLTIPANIYGNPAVSVPAGLVDGLPVGMQVMARHHADAELLDVSLAVERDQPWDKVAPTVAVDEPV